MLAKTVIIQDGRLAVKLLELKGYMELEAKFTGRKKDYKIVGNVVDDFPKGFIRTRIEDRF